MQSKTNQKNGSGRSVALGTGVLAAAFLIFAANLHAAPPAPKKPTGAAAHQGDEIFHQRCIVCHNKQPGDTTPFGPPNLYAAFQGPNAIKPAQAEQIITNGKGRMPAFGTMLTKTQIRDVIAYLKSRQE